MMHNVLSDSHFEYAPGPMCLLGVVPVPQLSKAFIAEDKAYHGSI